ncbi:hypothetical protein ES705_27211 [subsurface metagenome]
MKAFIIMPFDDETANDVYELCTKPICRKFNIKANRADEIFTTNPIIDDIINEIEEATVIIADISGKNPSVFYELGMSHMLKKSQTIMITHDPFGNLPFDIAHFRIIKYENSIAGKSEYEKQLTRTLENILRDYKLIYKNEYEMIMNLLMSSPRQSDLLCLMSIGKVPKPIKKGMFLQVEGHNEKTGAGMASSTSSAEDAVPSFIMLKYAELVGDIIILTEKGKAFVELLEERGLVLDYVNGHSLTKGYISQFEKTAEKPKNKKIRISQHKKKVR